MQYYDKSFPVSINTGKGNKLFLLHTNVFVGLPNGVPNTICKIIFSQLYFILQDLFTRPMTNRLIQVLGQLLGILINDRDFYHSGISTD